MEIEAFVRQSNLIEGITRDPTGAELEATEGFVIRKITVASLEGLVSIYQPGARLRDKAGMDVQVGSHIPPPGGPQIRARLQDRLNDMAVHVDPWTAHCRYEKLHPFTDGNGRSGRTLWLWHMYRLGYEQNYPLSFLQAFYYQTLQEVAR